MKTSVIIATFDLGRFDDLAAAVNSVRHQTVPALEVIVAVDRNPDLAERARRELSDARVVDNTSHPGAGGARNCGAAVAQGDILAFLDDDAVAAPDWIETLERALTDPQVMGVGGLIEAWWLTAAPPWFPDEFGWVVGCSYAGLPETRSPVRNLIAANMAMRRERFEAIGGFRAAYGKQGSRSEPEETDLCIRAGQAWPDQIWVYDPEMRVKHRVPASRVRYRYFLRRCLNEGIGKASLAQLVGQSSALQEERRYVREVLPRGVITGITDFVTRRRAAGLLRAGAILSGLAITAVGYGAERAGAQLRARGRRAAAGAQP